MRIVNTKMKSVFTLSLFIFFTVFSICETKMIYNTLSEPLVFRTKSFSPSVMRKTCLLRYDEGPCRAEIQMYYYNAAAKKCDTFHWGGCQGNGNRFETEEECVDSCLTKNTTVKERPNFCKLSFDYGFCFGNVKRYYYDYLWKTCKETIYSGCGGNRNNFYNMEECESFCRFGLGKPSTTEDPNVIKTKVLIINPPNTTPARGRDQAKWSIPDDFTQWISTPRDDKGR